MKFVWVNHSLEFNTLSWHWQLTIDIDNVVMFAGCLENGDIHLFGLHENSELLHHSSCKVNTSATGQTYLKILYDCQKIKVRLYLTLNS